MLTLIVTTSIIGCKEDGRVVAPELETFIGSWAMESVTLEGTLLEEWQQVVITFEQESEEGGTQIHRVIWFGILKAYGVLKRKQ
ncbi:MAG: hypothetical protein R8G66_08950 [Cytophagales bacterium]|nr:hypothetical protein [Cytophagales bacterium]